MYHVRNQDPIRKKTLATNIREKVTASATVKAKKASTDHNGSYIQPVSTLRATVKDTVIADYTQTVSSFSNGAILSLLKDMNRSNKEIVTQIVTLEHQQSSNCTRLTIRSHSYAQSHCSH